MRESERCSAWFGQLGPLSHTHKRRRAKRSGGKESGEEAPRKSLSRLAVAASPLDCSPCALLRWLNRVMQDHEARASDLNGKLIFSFFLLFS